MARKRITVAELAQLDQAYGRELTWKRKLQIIIKPAIITALYSFVLLGVVGMKPDEQATVVQSLPEYQTFAAVDPDDAKTYLENIQKGKNKTYWESDMPSLKHDAQTTANNQHFSKKNAEAYDAMVEAYQKKSLFPTIIKSVISLWRELIFFLIGLAFGWFYVLPRQIKMEYNMSALQERNASINLMTQSFADTSRPPIESLQTARDNTHGKLKDDFRLLTTTVSKRESDASILKTITDMRHEYADDMVFDLYMEQVATYLIKGDISQETFKNLMSQHNAIMEETIAFQQHKDMASKKLITLMYMSFGVGLFVAMVVMNILGVAMFMDKVWGSFLVGFGGSLFIAGGTLLIYAMMMKQYFDNDLMSM